MIIKALVSHLAADDKAYYERFYLKEGDRIRLTPLNRDREFFSNLMNDTMSEPKSKSQRALSAATSEISLRLAQDFRKIGIFEVRRKAGGDGVC